jgi:tetratricopeptide (TPR) repeat protein
MIESLHKRRRLGLVAFVAFVLLLTLAERRVMVPFVLDRPAVDDVTYWQAHVDRNGMTAASHLRLGIAYAKNGQLDRAEASFTAALDLQPNYDAAAIGRYGVVARRHEGERALVDLEDYARANSLCAVCWQNLAADYLNLRKLGAAEAAVEALLASDFSVESKMYNVENMEVEASILAGRVYAARGDRLRAIEFFREAIEKDPNEVRAYILQAKNLLANQDPEAALAVLKDATRRADQDQRTRREIDRLRQRALEVRR